MSNEDTKLEELEDKFEDSIEEIQANIEELFQLAGDNNIASENWRSDIEFVFDILDDKLYDARQAFKNYMQEAI